MPFSEQHGYKYLTVAQLKRVLSEIPDDHIVAPNAVANLRVGKPDFQYAGYIDFNSDEGNYET